MSAKWTATGKTVWEINKDDLPGIALYTVQEVSRLANGDTLINNWNGSAPAGEKAERGAVDRSDAG